MDKIINNGEPDNVKQINDTAKELEVVSQRVRKLREKKEQLEDFKEAQEEQMGVLETRLEKVMAVAQEYGIDDEIKREEQKFKDEKKLAQKETLMRKKKVLMQAHASNKKKIEIQMSKEKKQLRDLVNQKREYSEQLNTKSDVLL